MQTYHTGVKLVEDQVLYTKGGVILHTEIH